MELRKRFTREETRARIMAKADELFRQFGTSKTTVADIADGLNMSTANIYKFFPSKDAIVETSAQQNIARLKEMLLDVARSGGAAADRLEKLVLTIIQFNQDTFRSEGQAYKLFIACIEQNWACVRTFNADFSGILEGIIEDGVRTGEFRRLDAAATALILHDCMRSVMHPLLIRQIGDADIESRASAMVRFLADALK